MRTGGLLTAVSFILNFFIFWAFLLCCRDRTEVKGGTREKRHAEMKVTALTYAALTARPTNAPSGNRPRNGGMVDQCLNHLTTGPDSRG